MRTWGNEEENNISVCYDELRNVKWIDVEFDLRGQYSDFVNEVVDLAREYNCLFYVKEEKFIEPDTENLITEIRNSLAYKYVCNPPKAIEDLDKEK